MEFKGTKGKWITEEFDSGSYQKSILILLKKNNTQIAEVNFEYLRNDDYVYNALLISKAPEMLEMLKDVKDYLGSDKRAEVEQLIKEATEL